MSSAFSHSKHAMPGAMRDAEIPVKPLDFEIVKRLYQYSKPYDFKRNILILLVCMRAGQLATVAWMLGAIIDGPISTGNLHGLIAASLGFAAFAAFTQLTFYFRQKFALQFGEAIVHDLRGELFEYLQKMPIGFFHKMPVGRIISRMTSDIESIRIGVQDVLFVSLVNGGQMLVAAGFMIFIDWVLFLVMVGLVPVLWTLNRVFKKRLSKAHREVQESFSRVTTNIAESVSGIRETQGFVRQKVNAGQFQDLVVDHSHYNMTVARTSGVFIPILELNSQIFMAILLSLGGFRVLSPEIEMPVGSLIQFIFLANVFFAPIQTLGNQYNNILNAMAGAERVFRMLDTEPEWQDRPGAVDLPPIQGRVEMKEVSFAYEPDRPALHDISFVAEPGQCIALVGHTGSGKSSIINLVAKFYLPTSGEVRIDGHNLLDVTSHSLHRQIGLVQQNNFLFSGTILDNIRIGHPEATEQDILDAARQLDCLDLLEALPRGFQTEAGERGAGLSLGQRQLVCFVRAMIADPRILILDEATSSIDALTEARIQQSLARLMKGRTSFVVAHRLSTVRNADLVLVLREGLIVERGNHTQLMDLNQVYARLYRQFIQSTGS